VVAGEIWDSWGFVPWFDEGVVVRAHICETVGVLVEEGDCGHWVEGACGGDEAARFSALDAVEDGLGWCGGVVGVFAGKGLVSDGEEKDLDCVGETDVVLFGGVDVSWVEAAWWGGLNLFDEDVAGGACHSLTFVVGDNGVVSPDVDSAKFGFTAGEGPEVAAGAGSGEGGDGAAVEAGGALFTNADRACCCW